MIDLIWKLIFRVKISSLKVKEVSTALDLTPKCHLERSREVISIVLTKNQVIKNYFILSHVELQ